MASRVNPPWEKGMLIWSLYQIEQHPLYTRGVGALSAQELLRRERQELPHTHHAQILRRLEGNERAMGWTGDVQCHV